MEEFWYEGGEGRRNVGINGGWVKGEENDESDEGRGGSVRESKLISLSVPLFYLIIPFSVMYGSICTLVDAKHTQQNLCRFYNCIYSNLKLLK